MEKIEFHNRVYEGYNRLRGKRKNIYEIDAALSIEEVHKHIVGIVDNLLNGRNVK